jgi:hypothetical protein
MSQPPPCAARVLAVYPRSTRRSPAAPSRRPSVRSVVVASLSVAAARVRKPGARLGNRTGWDDEDEMRQAEMAPGAPKETLCPTRSRSVMARACSERPRCSGREAHPTLPPLTRRTCPRATGQCEHDAARIVRGSRRRSSSGRAWPASSPLGAGSTANVKDPPNSVVAGCAAG